MTAWNYKFEKKDMMMKRSFRQSMVALFLCASGIVFTSCNSDVITQILTTFLSVMLDGNNTTYTYSGTANLEMYDYDAKTNTYEPSTKVEKKMAMNVTVTLLSKESVVTVALGDIVMNQTTIRNYTFNTHYINGKIDPEGPSLLTGGVCTFNGKANTEVAASAIQGTLTSGESSRMDLTHIYIQVGDKLLRGTFTGSNATTSAQ